MTKLAYLISKQEGFGIPGAIPTILHNPGDLRHSPHSTHPHGPNDIGTIDTDAHGWEDLERQLQLYSSFSLRELVNKYAPPSQNDTRRYLDYICKGLGLPPNTLVSEALKIKV